MNAVLGIPVVIVRYGEISIKSSRTRPVFERLLIRNIRDALNKSGIKSRIKRIRGRILVYTEDAEEAARVIARVFGVVSVSPAEEYELTGGIEQIKNVVVEKYGRRVCGRKFAVRATRSGTHDFKSPDVERVVGGALKGKGGIVDLTNPEITVRVEIRDNKFYIFAKILHGPGGLPIGSEGRVLALFSGGIDSPVAAWLMMKRGCTVDFLFINPENTTLLSKVSSVLLELINRWAHGYTPLFYVCQCKDEINLLKNIVRDDYKQVVLKCLMYRIACKLAQKENYIALITGESLGQASSQTLQNLRLISKRADLPVLRPLIGLDKDEITKLARKIGTYEKSSKIREFCGIARGPVTTKANSEILQEEEKKLLEAIEIQKIVEKKISVLSPEDIITLSLRTRIDLSAAEVIFLDPPPFEYNGKIISFMDALDLPHGKYIVVCKNGVKARLVADALRETGSEAIALSFSEFREYLEQKNICQ